MHCVQRQRLHISRKPNPEDGLSVYGFGEKKASEPYVNSCNDFFYCDLLLKEDAKTNPSSSKPKPPLQEILAAIDETSREGGRAHLSAVRSVLNKLIPGFRPQNYGSKNLTTLMESIPSLECESNSDGSYVKRK
ncbi:hypothetical protein EHS39_12975 [Ensifer sp. MPMI2T]|nr:hypothetical protein EHS39_12975 [Ensifer sp. MPMI2T]